jgi:iron-sulfur cluster assembly protein
MSVHLTANAAKQIKRVIEDQNLSPGVALRIRVADGGCSGFEYRMEFSDEIDERSDSVREIEGVRVAVDHKSALYLDGTEIDYRGGLDRPGFVFNNPNAAKTCGCGSSFRA